MGITDTNHYDYNEEYDSFCYQNCIKQILDYNQIKNSNMYINMSLDFHIKVEGDRIYLYEDGVRSIVPEFSSFIKRFYYKNETGIVDKVWNENLKIITKGMPIIVGVDTYYLPYLPYYHIRHGKHTVILDKYDSNEDKVYILDWYSPWFFSGSISKTDFLKARDSLNEDDGGVYSGSAINNNWAIINAENINGNIIELIYSQLNHSYNQYYIKNNCNYNGIFATRKLKDYIMDLNIEFTDDLEKILDYLHKRIFRLNKRRILFKLFLKESYSIIDNEIFQNAIGEIQDIFDAWEILIYKILKCKMRISEKNFLKIIEQLDVIITKEEKYKNILLKLLHLCELESLGVEKSE